MAEDQSQSRYSEADMIAAELIADMGDAHGAHLPMTTLARAYIALRSERRACFPKAVGWIREWDGDDSDIGNFVIEWGTEPPADNHQWTPLYAEDEAVYESIR